MTFIQFLSFMGLPSAVVGLGVTIIIMMIHKQNKKAEQLDKNMYLLIKLAYSGMELSEATAISYINGRCNGEITAALAQAKVAKNDYNNFVLEQSAANM